MADRETWQEEKAYLADTINVMKNEIQDISNRLSGGVSAANKETEESLMQMYADRHNIIKNSIDSPYFARIDFTPENEDLDKIYIGKTNVLNTDNKVIVTDWRAPVSSMYYDGSTGNTKYKSPAGTVRGNLSLKRNYSISNGELSDVDDVYVGKQVTPKSIPGKLYARVSREVKVPEKIEPDIKLDPDKLTVSEIDKLLLSSLSELSDTKLKTIIATIQAEQNAVIRADIHKNYIVQGTAGSGKTSVALHRIAYLAYTLMKDFRPESFIILTQSKLLLNFISDILPELGVNRVPQRSLESLVKRITEAKFELDETESRSRYKSSFDILSDIDDFIRDQQMNKKKRDKIDILPLYSSFLKYVDHEPGAAYNPKSEDLAPMLYLYSEVVNLPDMRVLHIVIDEAQDFSAMQLYVLQKVFSKSTFTLFGDVAQSINPRGNQEGWMYVNTKVWNGDAKVLHLEKSYRSTIEIIEASGNVLDELPDIPRGVAVIRHGEPVSYTDVKNETGRMTTCARFITNRLNQGYKNIAVIMSQQNHCDMFAKYINEHLASTSDLKVATLTSKSQSYNGGVCLLSASVSKGLEFDSVIVADADRYQDNAIGKKLQYVAMTRAMHTLDVVRRV